MSKKLKSLPAYFLSLTLENVRSFGTAQTISFARPDGSPAQWTIILGNNGVGKTTILKALAMLRPASDSFNSDRWMPSVAEVSWRYKWPFLRGNGERKANLACSVSIGSDLDKETSEPVPPHSLTLQTTGHSKNKSGTGFSHASVKWNNPGSLICYGYGAGRTIGTSTLSESADKTDTCLSLFDDRANLLNPEEWFLQLDYTTSKTKGDAQRPTLYLERVKQALLAVLPEVEDIRVTTGEQFQQRLELKSPYGWIRLSDMSLGYQTLVVWLVDFASKLFLRYPDSDNPLAEPAVVLIDEIDLHLHPEWQRRLIGFLSETFPQTQFIATAHSPLVVQAAGDQAANVVLIQREGDHAVVRNETEVIQGWRIDQILTSELFGLETTRSPKTETLLQERVNLLSKTKLTSADKQRLDLVETDLQKLPVGNSAGEVRADSVLRELASKLGKEDLLK